MDYGFLFEEGAKMAADEIPPAAAGHPIGYCLLVMSYQIRYRVNTTQVKNDETNPFCCKSLPFNKRWLHF